MTRVLVDCDDVFRSVDRTQFQLFHPSLEDMLEAEKLFCSTPAHRIDYYVSAERMDHVPALKQPEVGGKLHKVSVQLSCNFIYLAL